MISTVVFFRFGSEDAARRERENVYRLSRRGSSHGLRGGGREEVTAACRGIPPRGILRSRPRTSILADRSIRRPAGNGFRGTVRRAGPTARRPGPVRPGNRTSRVGDRDVVFSRRRPRDRRVSTRRPRLSCRDADAHTFDADFRSPENLLVYDATTHPVNRNSHGTSDVARKRFVGMGVRGGDYLSFASTSPT